METLLVHHPRCLAGIMQFRTLQNCRVFHQITECMFTMFFLPFFFAHWNFSLDLKGSHWNFGANYPSPLQYNGLQLRGIWRWEHIWHGEASEARVDLQAYGGNPPGQHRMLPTFGHPELNIHPAGSPLPGLAAGTSKLFVWTCKKWSSISMRRNRTS